MKGTLVNTGTVIAGSLIVMGLVLLLAEQVGTRRKELADLTTRDGVAVGLAQSMALVPGVSRSGATISAGLFLGYKREAAARFSFLLSVPAVVLSGLFQLKDIGTDAGPGTAATIVATIVSFVVGYAAIRGPDLWHGGLGWGPRYLVPVTPFVALWLLPVAEALPQAAPWKRLGALGMELRRRRRGGRRQGAPRRQLHALARWRRRPPGASGRGAATLQPPASWISSTTSGGLRWA